MAIRLGEYSGAFEKVDDQWWKCLNRVVRVSEASLLFQQARRERGG